MAWTVGRMSVHVMQCCFSAAPSDSDLGFTQGTQIFCTGGCADWLACASTQVSDLDAEVQAS